MTLDLKRDQAELRAASQALLELVDQPHPAQPDRLVAARWRVARALLRYLPLIDRQVYARLRCHADPRAVFAAQQFMAEAEAIYRRYESHAARWTPDEVALAWPVYRSSVRQQAAMVRDRLDREVAELQPFLATAPDLPAIRSPGDRNWARDGWKFRDLLGIDAPGMARSGPVPSH